MTHGHQLGPDALADHVDRLYRGAWGLCGSRADAEDLVQQTFARVLRKPRFLRSDDDLCYLLRVLRHTYINSCRAAARRPQTTPLPDDVDLVEDRHAVNPTAAVGAEELYALIAQLPPDFRDVLVAVDLVGLSHREAATALRLKEETISTRLHRARQRVSRLLDPGVPASAKS
jgi:RNA polymerase sigma-70 factor (ECF subfamily)